MKADLPDPTYAAMVAVVAGGFGLLVIVIILFVTVTVFLRVNMKQKAASRQVQQTTAKDGALYTGLLPQSTMGLMSSTSGQSFASSPSELFTIGKCISGSVGEFNQHQNHQAKQATPSITVTASVHPAAYENKSLRLDEKQDNTDGSSSHNSEEEDESYRPIQMMKTDSLESSFV